MRKDGKSECHPKETARYNGMKGRSEPGDRNAMKPAMEFAQMETDRSSSV